MAAEPSIDERPRQLLSSGVARVWLFIGAVTCASVGVWAFVLAHYGPLRPNGFGLPWWALAVAFFLSEAFVVHLHFRKQAHTLSASEIGLVLGLFLARPGALLAAQVLGAGLALAVHRRQKATKLVFNLAEMSLCSGIAVLIFRALVTPADPSPRATAVALAAAIIEHTAGLLLVSAVIAVAEGRLAAPQLPRTLATSLVGVIAVTCLGLLGVELLTNDPFALTLVVVPVVACGLSFRAYMEQREQREHVEFLYESMRATQGAPEFGLAVGELLVAARRLLRADYAEILLLSPTPGEPVLRSRSGPDGETLMHQEPYGLAEQMAVERVGASERPMLLPRRRADHGLDELLAARGLGDAIVGVLRGEHRVFGLLIVGGRLSDVSTFNEDDVGLFETFGAHAGVLLENGRLERSLAQVTELQEQLRFQAYHDALTGLPNRLLFSERVAEAMGRKPRAHATHAILFLDLDRFKVVNDSWGHAAGDDLLVQVAGRIRDVVRPEDIPARLGGDEFGILLEDTSADGAEHAAARLVRALTAPFSLSTGHQATVHVSIGIALAGPDVATADELIRNADIAMYTAKSDERHCVLHQPALHERIRRRRELALELERAVEEGEIVVHYQPVVSLADGTIHAFEALARWQHPERGLLGPAEWLSVAEESGLIFEVGSSVREQAFRCAAAWQDAIPDASNLGLWVNVAPGELTNERLVEELAVALTRAHLDARTLTVEITESSVIQDEQGALSAMRRLRDLGVRLSIDDFGTGYSSLARLADFPIELLKIPKPFVAQLVGSAPDVSFVDAILRLAGSIGLIASAEGIERPEQARELQRLGCGLGQGFLFSPPVPAHDAMRLLRTGGVAGRTWSRPAALALGV
jgi:diguanylate cyclase (GGDEF)-like protein